MSVYTLGFRLQMYRELLTNDNLETVGSDSVILCDADKCTVALSAAYKFLKRAMLKGLRPIVVSRDKEALAGKTLGMLLVAYGHYDVYFLYPGQELTQKFIEAMVKREPSRKDVSTFIGTELIAYDTLSEVLMDLQKTVDSGDIGKVKALISENRAAINGAAPFIDSLKQMADEGIQSAGSDDAELASLRSQLETANKELADLRARLEQAEQDSRAEAGISEEEVQRRVDVALAEAKKSTDLQVRMLRDELKGSKEKIAELEASINSNNPIIKAYTEIKTPLIRCGAKSIMYFKEVTQVRYSMTMLTKMLDILIKFKHLKAKFVVYDNAHAFMSTYKPVPTIDYSTYKTKREKVNDEWSKVVVIEANADITTGILGADYDVVIILDRLKQATDLVSGNNVHKFWLINSQTDFMSLQLQYHIDQSAVVAPFGEFSTGFCIREVKDYKEKTPSAKLQDYFSMKNMTGASLMDDFFAKAKVGTIKVRGTRGN